MTTMFLVAAMFCSAQECVQVATVMQPRKYDLVDEKWCDRYAVSRASELARHYIPRIMLTVKDGSVACAEY